jgi:hypothetical protein
MDSDIRQAAAQDNSRDLLELGNNLQNMSEISQQTSDRPVNFFFNALPQSNGNIGVHASANEKSINLLLTPTTSVSDMKKFVDDMADMAAKQMPDQKSQIEYLKASADENLDGYAAAQKADAKHDATFAGKLGNAWNAVATGIGQAFEKDSQFDPSNYTHDHGTPTGPAIKPP